MPASGTEAPGVCIGSSATRQLPVDVHPGRQWVMSPCHLHSKAGLCSGLLALPGTAQAAVGIWD